MNEALERLETAAELEPDVPDFTESTEAEDYRTEAETSQP